MNVYPNGLWIDTVAGVVTETEPENGRLLAAPGVVLTPAQVSAVDEVVAVIGVAPVVKAPAKRAAKTDVKN
jgi:hypothetical protein